MSITITDRDRGDLEQRGQSQLAAGEEHPRCPRCDSPLALVLQLRLDRLPSGARATPSMLQVFTCADGKHDGVACINAHDPRDPSSPLHLVRTVPVGPGRLSEHPAHEGAQLLAFRAILDLPGDAEATMRGMPELTVGALRAHRGSTYGVNAPAGEHKLGGYATPDAGLPLVRCATCGEAMDLLFQIETPGVPGVGWMWSTFGTAHLQRCREHVDLLSFAWAPGVFSEFRPSGHRSGARPGAPSAR